MTCLSCHSLHAYETVSDQLSREKAEDESCLQCHQSFSEDLTAHTRHPADSTGSRCQNCHMPHTTYGLFVAMRSHRIDSPSAAVSKQTGRPNACNLCHLDQSLAWTNQHLIDWYGQTPVELDDEDRNLAASIRWLLGGDAAQRAIVAWHMGWEPAQQVSGKGWEAPHLAALLADPYASIRRVAERSIKTLPGFADFSYDHLAARDELVARRDHALQRWQRSVPQSLDRSGALFLLESDGTVDESSFKRQLDSRDNTPLRIIE